MSQFQFWKSWPAAYQRIFWLLTGISIVTLIFLWTSNLTSPSPVLNAKHTQEVEAAEFVSHTFQLGALKLDVPADVFVVFERTAGAELSANPAAGIIFISILVFAIVTLFSIATTFTKFWFLTSAGFFILFLFSLRLETILLFGLPNFIPTLLIIALFAGTSAYFQFVNKTINFSGRLIIHLMLVLIVTTCIYFFSHVDRPFLHLSANGIIGGTVLTVLFVFMIAHEIIAGLIAVLTRGVKQTRTIQHFFLISLIYIANLGLIYANKKLLIHLDLFPVNLMVFLTISAILGLWGFRKREAQYESIMEANPFGVFVYLSLAIIAFGTIGYFYATANDPVIHFAEDVVLYSHLGYGAIFLIYILANFGPMLSRNLQVYKVLYKPETLPYFTFRFAGLILTFTFFAYSNWKVSLHEVYAGYYNAWGDIYLPKDALNLAQENYNHSVYYSIRNYHAHYALAQINAAQNEHEKEVRQFQLLVDSRPIDLAYLNLGQLTEKIHSRSSAISLLKKGLHDHPKNARIESELGLAYAQLEKSDSALFLTKAAIDHSSDRSYTTNLMGLRAKFKSTLSADSLFAFAGSDDQGAKSNALALASIQGTSLAVNIAPLPDTLSTIYDVTILHNYLLNHLDQPDTSIMSKAIALARKSPNPYFKDFMLAPVAYAYYANGQVTRAFKLMREVAYVGQQEKYFNAMGLWALEQNAPATAQKYFNDAINQGFSPAFFNKAVSFAEANDLASAVTAWDSLTKTRDSRIVDQAKKIRHVLRATTEDAQLFNDEEKYVYARYRIALGDDAGFEKIMANITDPDWKARAIIDRSKKLDEMEEMDRAYDLFSSVQKLNITTPVLYQEILHLNLRFLARQKDWVAVAQQLKEVKTFSGIYKLDKIYLEALLNTASNKGAAANSFAWLAEANPFFEDAVVASINFLKADTVHNATTGKKARVAPDKLTLYSQVVTALDLNPNSVKLLKVYAVMSLELDFDEAGQTALDQLKAALSREAFVTFLKENPALFEVGAN